MAIGKNWTRYEVNIGWKEVDATEVFENSIILKVLEETLDKTYLENILDLDGFLENTLTKTYINNIMSPSYTKGELKFNE